jgi:hypothetical protein
MAPETVLTVANGRKSKKAANANANAEPKEKRPPNAWIVFTTRIGVLLKTNEKNIPVAQQKTFASHLKSIGGESYASISDERVLEELAGWTCPEPKPRVKKDADADAASETGSERKKRAPMTEEAKAAMAAKKAATKAATKAAKAVPAATAASAAPAASAATAASAANAATIVASTPVETAAAPPAKKAIKKAAATPKPVSLKFESWSYDGEECWQNERGDCLNPEGEWMGRFEGGKLNNKFAQPDDLEAAIQELME